MSDFKELRRSEFEKYLEAFSKPGTLKYRHNKWVGLNRKGEPFAVHVKHGSTSQITTKLHQKTYHYCELKVIVTPYERLKELRSYQLPLTYKAPS